MPRDGSGTYTLPAGNPVVDGTIIETTWANPTMSDIAVQLNNVLTRDGVLGPNLPFKFIAGSIAAPGATFAAAPSTGFYWPGAGQLGVSIVAASVGTFQATGWNGAVVGNVTGNVTGNITGNVVVPLGAVGAPSISFSGDSNTGMWSAGADIITWSAGGVAGMQLGANQLTFASPWVIAPWLGAVGTPSYTFNGDLNTGMYSLGADQIAWATAGVKRFEVSAAGDMGIGGTPNAYGAGITALTINAATVPLIDLNIAGVRQATFDMNISGGGLLLGTIVNQALCFYQNAGEVGRFAATGRPEFYVGGTATSPFSAANRSIVQINGVSNTLLSLTKTGVGALGYLYHDGTDMSLNNSVAAGILSFMTNTTIRLTVTADGRFYGTALHNNAGAVTGTANQYIASGTYTPTLTNVANATGLVSASFQWIRVGNVVSVSGVFTTGTTLAANTTTQIGISLPIASGFAGQASCGGAGVRQNGGAREAGLVYGDSGNNRAQFEFSSTNTAAVIVSIKFQYVVL